MSLTSVWENYEQHRHPRVRLTRRQKILRVQDQISLAVFEQRTDDVPRLLEELRVLTVETPCLKRSSA